MFRRTIFLAVASVAMPAGFGLSGAAGADPPASPPPASEPPSQVVPLLPVPQARSSAAQTANAPAAQPAPTAAPPAGEPAPEVGPPGLPGGISIPGLGNFIRPDGLNLPGGVGFIRRTPDQVGVHINTPQGPFDISIPRRQRDADALEPPPTPGNGTDLPLPGGPPPGFGRPVPEAIPNGGQPGPGAGADQARQDRASHEFRVASHLFRARNYPAAARHIGRGLLRAPGDHDLLQLRSLSSFAMSDYSAAAHDAAVALAENQVWDWTTLRSLYRTVADYTTEYRALEAQAVANPTAIDLWFLLAYHNLVLGNREAAQRQFARVAALDPLNELARRWLVLAASAGPKPTTRAAVGTTTPLGGTSPRGPEPSGPFSIDLGKPGAPNQPAPTGPK